MAIHPVIAVLDTQIAELKNPVTARVREVRKEASRTLRRSASAEVLAIAKTLVERDRDNDRWIAYEIVAAHKPTMEKLSVAELRRLGLGIDSWQDVDTFASYVSGPAWREQRIPDSEIARWAKSKDMWWRGAAVVSTVPLNNKTRGGRGDAARTVAICELLLDDREPLVVKAVSWALRELSKRTPEEVKRFIAEHEEHLAPLIRREVSAKLSTGLKNPRRSQSRK